MPVTDCRYGAGRCGRRRLSAAPFGAGGALPEGPGPFVDLLHGAVGLLGLFAFDVDRGPRQRHRARLQACVELRVVGAEHCDLDRRSHRDVAMPAQQHDRAGAQRLRQSRALLRRGQQHIGGPEPIARVEDRRRRCEEGGLVVDRPQRNAVRGERQDPGRVRIDDRVDVGTRLVDLAMEEALAIGHAATRIDRRAVEIERHDVVGGHLLGRYRFGQQVLRGILRMTGADVPEAVDHALVGQDVIGIDQIVDRCLARRR